MERPVGFKDFTFRFAKDAQQNAVEAPALLLHCVNARIVKIRSDEAEGELTVTAAIDGGTEQDIVYEGMFYRQLDESSAGLAIESVTEIAPEDLYCAKYRAAVARLYDDCGADAAFLREMYGRGNRLYAHNLSDGRVYLVLAKRVCMGEMRRAIHNSQCTMHN